MAKLAEKIKNDLKQAMRDKNEKALSTLRLLLSAIKNKEISLRGGENVELADEQMLEVVGSEIKKRRDSAEAYQQGGRQDLAEREKSEIKILEKYMPEQLSDEDMGQIVKEIIDSSDFSSAHNFGQIMGLVMQKVKGQADGNKVSQIVKKLLSK